MEVFCGLADHSNLEEQFLIVYLKPADKTVTGFLQLDGSLHPQAMSACPMWKLEDINNLSQVFASEIASNQYSAAEIQSYLVQYRNDPWLAVKEVKEWTWNRFCLVWRIVSLNGTMSSM